MPLLSLWRSAPETIDAFNLSQIVSAAGDGDLRDDSLCATELRGYLHEVGVDRLGTYVDQCLAQAHPKGGYILQDLVNELGRRLDYDVVHGRYAGRAGQIGFDGLWESAGQPSIVVEVKTTDAYRISLDTIIGYRDRLAAEGRCTRDASVLVVVGRQDTGELEAQVRGSRHAWDVRLISAEALLRLAAIKVAADSPDVDGKVRGLLRPAEYTRLDALVDVVFSATRDVEGRVEERDAPSPDDVVPAEPRRLVMTAPAELAERRRRIMARWSQRFGAPLIARSRALHWSSDHAIRAACTISKRYPNQGRPYWYAYHPAWRDFLASGKAGVVVLGMMDRDHAYAVPRAVLEEALPYLNVTERPDDKTYWHLHVLEDAGGQMALYVPGRPAIDLSPFRFDLD